MGKIIMNLPNLPKQNKAPEADFGVELKGWVEKNAPHFLTSSLETKHTHGKDSFPFNEVKAEQLVFATRISSEKGAWIRVQGLKGEPDYIFLKNTPAYIVIRYPKFFCFITSGNFIFEKEKNKRKSLTAERAIAIAYKVVKLK